MELESIIENSKARFPTVDDVIDKCDDVYEYTSIDDGNIYKKVIRLTLVRTTRFLVPGLLSICHAVYCSA